MGTAGKLIPVAKHIVDGSMLNIANTKKEVMRGMSQAGIDDIPLKLIFQFGAEIENPGSVEAFAYEQSLRQIVVPTMAISGSVDRIAPANSVREGLREVGASYRRYREYGRRFGERHDYGHADLLIGKHAKREVYPDILNFLDEVGY